MHPNRIVSLHESSARPYSPDTAWGRRILAFLDRLAASDVPVLITGETGVGKEVLARAIHVQSSRANAPFFKLNCAALPSELIESELFGYERGAFTGAYKSTRGKFESAEGGTILLDEIGDMDLRLQAKLLQVLQDSQFLRVGGRQEISVNVRIIAATHKDLPTAARQGTFRQDLYYRLNVVSITVPPLRDRVDEILPLLERFRRIYSPAGDHPIEIPPDLRKALMMHTWPGNIRELENAVRKFVVMQQPEMLIEDLVRSQTVASSNPERFTQVDLPPLLRSLDHSEGKDDSVAEFHSQERYGSPAFAKSANIAADAHQMPKDTPNGVSGALRKMDEQFHRAEADAITTVLKSTLWNRKQAAELLNVDYKALLYKMKKLGLNRRIHA